MKETFKVGDKVRCIDPTGELVKDSIYTIRVHTDTCIYLEESSSRSYNYHARRFELLKEKEKSFEEQLDYAKSLNGKVVTFNGNKMTVSDILVFIKGVHNDNISSLVLDELVTKEWCVAIKSHGQTIPLKSIKEITTITVENVGDYKAIVHKDHVMVGCQKISKAKVEEILKAFGNIS